MGLAAKKSWVLFNSLKKLALGRTGWGKKRGRQNAVQMRASKSLDKCERTRELDSSIGLVIKHKAHNTATPTLTLQ